LSRTVECVARGGSAIAIVAVPHHDSDTVFEHRIEGVFVGDVITEIDRQQWRGFVIANLVDHPTQRLALVPIDVRP
jgi:D-serine deaminase-like pyridoxal phosphate-dependent protein